MPRRSTVAVCVGLAALAVTGAGALALARGESAVAPPSTTARSAPPTTRPTPRPTTATTSSTSTTPSTSSTTTTSTTTTIVPIVTHSADIGILDPVPVAAPVRVAIPALGIDGPVLPTSVNDAGELDVPPDARTLVWYRHGPVPGAAGSAVIAGHLNWKGVEGLFSNLAAVPVGSEVVVVYDDGTQRRFVTRSVELVEKPAVAMNGTFARDGESLLRLVTCGGEFDRSTRHYRSNVVLTAVPA